MHTSGGGSTGAKQNTAKGGGSSMLWNVTAAHQEAELAKAFLKDEKVHPDGRTCFYTGTRFRPMLRSVKMHRGRFFLSETERNFWGNNYNTFCSIREYPTKTLQVCRTWSESDCRMGLVFCKDEHSGMRAGRLRELSGKKTEGQRDGEETAVIERDHTKPLSTFREKVYWHVSVTTPPISNQQNVKKRSWDEKKLMCMLLRMSLSLPVPPPSGDKSGKIKTEHEF